MTSEVSSLCKPRRTVFKFLYQLPSQMTWTRRSRDFVRSPRWLHPHEALSTSVACVGISVYRQKDHCRNSHSGGSLGRSFGQVC
ncbi:hypothetical protein LY76DRAFT_585505 [Colletotrichum caudatum]|nr:hypothetical protein LY76DRAFT_585505 [Colletotrichum caudatum]